MTVAYKVDLDGGEYGEASVREFKVGIVNWSIMQAALECTSEQNEGNPIVSLIRILMVVVID